jgi:hypothetical protein
MDLDDAEFMAKDLMAAYIKLPAGREDDGFDPWLGPRWTFRFDDGIRRFGCCDHGNMEIRLSRRLTLANGEREVKNTLLHEIAHALCGPGVGHGIDWVSCCLRIGGDGKRCYTTEAGGGSVVPVPRKQRFVIDAARLEGRGKGK